MCVALLALDAIVHVRTPGAKPATRTIPIADFHTLPGDHPEVESALAHGELVTGVELPASSSATSGLRARYVKARDRAAFEFALASAAAAIETSGKTVKRARIALGGVATKPWRAEAVERALVGKPVAPATFIHAASALAETDAKTTEDNRFKLELVRRTIARALMLAGGVA
jgi:xanthine dehydrogenase YagS FAD-binding subunit